MIKESKITIKHYLEKKGNHISLNGGKIGFPLYCQVTYKRKTTKFRSFTRAVMTDTGYDDYATKKIIDNKEVFIPTLNIDKEIKLIESSIRNITKGNDDLNVLDKYFLKELKIYFEPIKERLLKIGWFFFGHIDLSKPSEKETKKAYSVSDILKYKPSEEENRLKKLYKNADETMNNKRFYESFNRENTLLENVYRVNTVLKTDIRPYFFNGTLLYWEIVELILINYKDMTTIEFMENFNKEDLYKFSQKTKYKFKKEDFEIVCNKLIYRILSLD